ncbi:MAG: hypothetical protein KGJ13_06950 [Patescibacteria group bacterium]|nr:hypothetical protein [Patescibacteria group bacterium]
MSAIEKNQGKRLKLLERKIEHHRDQAEACLREIRDDRLYRASHANFEDYCRERWGFTARGVNLRITQSEVRGKLGTLVPENSPLSQRAAAALAGYPSEVQREIVSQAAAEGADLTADELRERLEAWKDSEIDQARKEEKRALDSRPAGGNVSRSILGRIDGHLGKIEKLIQRLDLAENPDRISALADRLEELAGVLRGR